MLHVVQRNREAYIPLLLISDPSEQMVRRYLADGVLYSWLTEEDETIGVIHICPVGDTVYEIKNVSVRERYQGQGHGKRMMEAILKELKGQGGERVSVCTGNSSIGNLAFYQKLGFRMVEIEPDYFTREYADPIFEDGIQCLDRIHLVRPL